MGKDQEFLEAARNGNISHIEKVLNQKPKRVGPLASLRRGTGVNYQDSGGYSALHHACLNGHIDIVRLLLTHDASPILPDMRGSTPLHLAAWAGEEEIMRLLLAQSYQTVDVNLQTIEKETPLHCAAQHGHMEALTILLAHDADPNMRNSRGETPLDLACQYGRLEAVQMLIHTHPELIAAYSYSNLKSVQAYSKFTHTGYSNSPASPSLVISAPNTPTCNIFTHTCLHLASRNGHKQVVEVLLAAGVYVNVLTPSGSALHEAALCGKESVVKTLMKAGIDLNAADAEERTVMDVLREFPPNVTKHIIDVIYNFCNEMDTDETEDIFYRHHVPQQVLQNNRTASSHYQKQQYNNHYHFNSNNHLLNHTQQTSYNKQRFSMGCNMNGCGKSLDNDFLMDNTTDNSNAYLRYSLSTEQQDIKISPSSSLGSFEPNCNSPRSKSSNSGSTNPLIMSTFGMGTAPKKPPRRNISNSPTHNQIATSNQTAANIIQRSSHSPSNDSPYSHQSCSSSIGAASFDESHLIYERQHGNRLIASCREMPQSQTAKVSLSLSSDILENQSHDNAENLVPNSYLDISNIMKRPKPAPRTFNSLSQDLNHTSEDFTLLKSYNPNRKLKRSCNNYSHKFNESLAKGDANNTKMQIPQSPTNYQQPPTPEHPPPSSGIAERIIHDRIRPLSQEYKRRSILQQLQKFQKTVDMATSPFKHAFHGSQTHTNYDYIYIRSPNKLPIVTTASSSSAIYCSISSENIQGSTGSLSSSVSVSDHSNSVDNMDEEDVVEFVQSKLGKGIKKDVKANGYVEPTYAEIGNFHGAPAAISIPLVPIRPQQQLPNLTPIPVYATIHKKRGISSITNAVDQDGHKARPPIPAKPIVPERRLLKSPILPQLATISNGDSNSIRKPSASQTPNHTNETTTSQKSNDDNKESPKKSPELKPSNNTRGDQNSLNSFLSDDNSRNQQELKLTESSTSNDESSTAVTTTNLPASNSHESTILSPFNAEETRKKISEIIESFGSSILNTNLSPTNDIDLDFDTPDTSNKDRQQLIKHMRSCNLSHLEGLLMDHGYDNYKFLNGVFEPNDLEVLEIKNPDADKFLKFIKTLPKAEFSYQNFSNNLQENTLSQWLKSIQLPEYIEAFNKHLYNSMDSACGVWDVELQTVLGINKIGHRRRILQSIASTNKKKEVKPTKNTTNIFKENSQTKPHVGGGYRKNRPAPPPPGQKSAQQIIGQLDTLNIRTPSELLLELPEHLRTNWQHSSNILLKEHIKYEVYYLGSSVVKELRGTESTRKSIQSLRQNPQGTVTSMLITAKQPTAPAVNNQLLQQFDTQQQQQQQQQQGGDLKLANSKILLTLAISYRGVEFLDINTKKKICEHEIQNINCACQDVDDMRHFAYITKQENLHYCHVFSTDSTDLTTEILLTLGQAFEIAYQLALRDGITATSWPHLSNTILNNCQINSTNNKEFNS